MHTAQLSRANSALFCRAIEHPTRCSSPLRERILGQIQLQREREVSQSYNIRITGEAVDNAHSTQKTQSVSGKLRFLHMLKRERQSADVVGGQEDRRKQRLVAIQTDCRVRSGPYYSAVARS